MTAHTLPIGILTGPTATGKSGLALQFARKHPQIELINADSLLVYRGLNIGAAKPTPTELQEVPHHLVDIRNPDESFTAGEFLRAAQEAIRSISERGKRPLIVGGTGFYLQALLYGIWEAPSADPRTRTLLEEKSNSILHQELLSIDPPSALRIGLSDRYRLIRALEIIKLSGQTPTELQAKTPRQADPRFHLWVLDRSNEELQERIQHRTRAMLRQNFIAEVQALRDQFPHCRPLQAVGYAQVGHYLDGIAPQGRKIEPGLSGLQQEIELTTRQLVKKQRTWFRNQTQKVSQSRWFHLDDDLPSLNEAIQSLYRAQDS